MLRFYVQKFSFYIAEYFYIIILGTGEGSSNEIESDNEGLHR